MIKIKRIVANVLVAMMLVPNLSVYAVNKETYELTSQQENVETNESIENSQLNEESQTEEVDNKNVSTEESVDDSKEQGQTQEDESNHGEEVQEENIQQEEVDEVLDEESKEENAIEETTDAEQLKGSIYEEEKVEQPMMYSASSEEDEREEFRLTREAMKDYSILKTKTDSAYEVAHAYSDGTYRFVESAESYDEAMEILEKAPMPADDELVIPVIIARSGQVVYSTNSMGIVIKHIGGNVDPTFNNNSNLYTTEAMTSAYTYINHGYVKDVPVITEGKKSAKIQVGGYTGWINKDQASGNYDLEIVPITHITNPSYYVSQNGVLYHYISTNPKAVADTSGHKIAIGAAPSYMVNGRRYFSYDGNYFYDGANITNGLNLLVNDLKAGNKNNSINVNNPHYLYYQYLPFRSKSVYTAQELDNFISNNTKANSKLRGIGQALKNAENSYGVNASLMLGIAINESAWGMSSISQSKNNIFGLNAVDSNPGMAANEFPSVTACINDFAKNWISAGYADPADWRYYGGYAGNKNLGANVKYASDPFWGEKATKYAFDIDLQLSGNVNSLRDTNRYQLAMYTSTNSVVDKNGRLLYAVDNTWAQVGNTFIVTSKDHKNIVGRTCYEMFTERNTPATGGKYHGSYNWSDRGYVSTSGVKMINTQKPIEPPIEVIAGNDRYETAVKLSKSKYTTSDTVIIVNNQAVIDGVTAAPLAYNLDAPILLTYPQVLGGTTKNEIARLKAKKVIIVGSEGIINNSVVNELKSMGITDITRLAGSDRYDTSLAVAQYIDKNCYDVSDIFMVYGSGEADAVSVSSISGMRKMPIILTYTSSIKGNVFNWLKSEDLNNAYVIGSEGIINNNVLNSLNTITRTNISNNRVGGADRYETNAKIIDKFFTKNVPAVYATEAKVLIDTLTAGPIAAKDGAPIYIIRDDLTDIQKKSATSTITNKIVQVGKVVPTLGMNSLRKLLKKYDI